MTDDQKRLRHLEWLARAGISEEEWARLQRMKTFDESRLNAREAHVRYRGLQDAAASEGFSAIPRIKAMLGDSAPVVARGSRPIVFEVGMQALTVLQHLYRVSKATLDFGPVRVTRAIPAADIERRAAEALAGTTDAARADVLARVDHVLEDRVLPPDGDRPLVRAYCVLQHLNLIPYETQAVDPVTYLTQLQEDVFASQVRTEPSGLHLRIGTAEPLRTLGWVTMSEEGRWTVVVSEHPMAREARSDVNWLASRGQVPKDPMACLRYMEEFLQKRGYLTEIVVPPA